MNWFIGDIHGCVRELEALLKALPFEPGRDQLWSVGDLVNKGPESLQVLRLWRDVKGRGVLGNHDVYALQAGNGGPRRGHDTLDELLAAPDGEALLDALQGWPLLVHVVAEDAGREAWVVHGGLHPGWTDLHQVAANLNGLPHDEAWLEATGTRFATRVRFCMADGRMNDDVSHPDRVDPGYRPWDDYYSGEVQVVHGHWALRGYHRTGHVLGLDSGCVYGRELTAWCQEEDRIVQVAARQGLAWR